MNFKIKGVAECGENTFRFTVSSGFDGKGKQIRHTMTYKVPAGTAPSKVEKMIMEVYTDFSRKCKYSQGLDENMRLKKILVNNDLPALSVLALRHSNASLMINNGFDLKAISEHLGHCNTAITSDIYTHIFKEYKAKMAESIEKDLN